MIVSYYIKAEDGKEYFDIISFTSMGMLAEKLKDAFKNNKSILYSTDYRTFDVSEKDKDEVSKIFFNLTMNSIGE